MQVHLGSPVIAEPGLHTQTPKGQKITALKTKYCNVKKSIQNFAQTCRDGC